MPDYCTAYHSKNQTLLFFQINEIKTGIISGKATRYHEAASLYTMDWSTMTNTFTGAIHADIHSNHACTVIKIINDTIKLAMTGGPHQFGHYLVKVGPSGGLEPWSKTSESLPMEFLKSQGLSYSQLLSIKNGSELLLYGGQIGDQIFDGIYKFMAASKTWLQVGKMKFARAAHVVIPVQGLSCP